MTIRKAALIAIAVMVLPGCGGKFTCPAPEAGITCEPVSEVYRRVVDSGTVSAGTRAKAEREKEPAKAAGEGSQAAADIVRKIEQNSEVPLRIPPKIVRIWIAPWEDGDGDLNQGGYIYSEISDPRGRWVFGEKAPDETRLMKLFSGKAPGTPSKRGDRLGEQTRRITPVPKGEVRTRSPSPQRRTSPHVQPAGK